LRPRVRHSFSDRLERANIKKLSKEHLSLAVNADSPNSASKSCLVREIHEKNRIQISAVAQILRDFPEQILFNPDRLVVMTIIQKLIDDLPEMQKKAVTDRLAKNHARSLKDNAKNEEDA